MGSQDGSLTPLENVIDDRRSIYPKHIPAISESHSSVCISFLMSDVPADVLSNVFEEAIRVLKPGGAIYVLAMDENIASKNPRIEALTSSIQRPSVRHGRHEIELQEILNTNKIKIPSFSSSSLKYEVNGGSVSRELKRWVGRKPKRI